MPTRSCGAQECCRRFHWKEATPETPEQLMRARFAAYVSQAVKFIVNTTHPSNSQIDGSPGSTLEQDIYATCKKLRFLQLKVLEAYNGEQEDEAFVRFQAWFRVVGQLDTQDEDQPVQLLKELSKFRRQDGKWWYLDAAEVDTQVL